MNLGWDSLLELCRASVINRSFIKHRMCVQCGHIFFLKTLKLYHEEFGHESISNPGAVSGVANIKICVKKHVG